MARSTTQAASGSLASHGAHPRAAGGERRAAVRIPCKLLARAYGRYATYTAAVLDVSRTGALLAITDDRWDVAQGLDRSGVLGLSIASHFGGKLRIEFADLKLVITGEVVHLHRGDLTGKPTTYLGCRFAEALSDDQWFALGTSAPLGPPRDSKDPAAEGRAGAAGAAAPSIPRPPEPARVRVQADGALFSMHGLLSMLVQRRGSDLHIKGGSPVRMRIDGSLVELGDHCISSADAEALMREILTPEQIERFERDCDLDLAHSAPGLGRFRINVLRARGQMGMALRRIPEDVPTLEELELDPLCRVVAEKPRGLVLVTGPTGSGKSTTLAAMIRHVNHMRACHIVTMEDPIEYLHKEARAHITQREVGHDTRDFASALRRALRQDPDVILVGEMRDLETVALAVTAAETGHLVFATLHTTSAILAVDRIVDVFPPVQQRQIRMQLADSLQAIFAQTLLPRIGGGIAVAQEILVANGAVRALIREGKTPQIANVMQTGGKLGMRTLEDALNILIARKVIRYETAVAKANHPELLAKPRHRRRESPAG